MTRGQIRKSIKAESKKTLSGAWGVAIAVILIAFLISIATGVLESVPSMLSEKYNREAYEYVNTVTDGALDSLTNTYIAEYESIIVEQFGEFGAIYSQLPEEERAAAIKNFLISNGTFTEILSAVPEGSSPEFDKILDALTSADFVRRLAISSLITGVLGIIVTVAVMAITAAVTAGKTAFFVAFADDNRTRVSKLFSWFKPKRMFKALGLDLLVSLILCIPVVAFFIGIFVCAIPVGLGASLEISGLVIAGVALIFALFAAFVAAMIIIACRFAIANFMLVTNENVGLGQIISQSGRLMKGHVWEYIVFGLSWLGWDILNLLTFGFLSLYTAPYHAVAEEKFFSYVFKDGLDRGTVDAEFIPAEPEPLPEITDFDLDSVIPAEAQEAVSAEEM